MFQMITEKASAGYVPSPLASTRIIDFWPCGSYTWCFVITLLL